MNLAYINKLSMQEPSTFRAAHQLFLSVSMGSAYPVGSFPTLAVRIASNLNLACLSLKGFLSHATDARCVCCVDVSDISRRFTRLFIFIDSNSARFLPRKNDNGPLISAGHLVGELNFYRRRLVLGAVVDWDFRLFALVQVSRAISARSRRASFNV